MRFKLEKKTRIILVIAAVVLIIAVLLYLKFFRNADESFKLNTLLLKSVIKKEDFISSNLKITSLKENNKLNLEIKNLEGIAFLKENNFTLNYGEIKDIEVVFKDEKNPPGVYVGSILVKDSAEKEIPVILEIQTREILFAVNLDASPTYKEVVSGDKISVGVKIYNLNDTKTHPVDISYAVKNTDGESIVEEKESLVAGTEAVTTKTIVLPENMDKGNYVFYAVLKFGDSVSTSSYLFSVVGSSIVNFNSSSSIIVFSIVILIFLIGIIFLVFYMIRERDKLFVELKKQHERELKAVTEKVIAEERFSLGRAGEGERKKIAEEFQIIKKRAVSKIKEKQKKQKVEFRKLRKQRKKSEMERKLEEWKKQGYNVGEFVSDIKKQTEKDMKKNLARWGKEGYDTSVLKR